MDLPRGGCGTAQVEGEGRRLAKSLMDCEVSLDIGLGYGVRVMFYIPARMTSDMGAPRPSPRDSYGNVLIVEKVTVTAEETVAAMLKKSKRSRLPMRRAFVQGGPQNKPVAGQLADFVRAHDELALDLYLLMRAVASAPPYEANYEAAVWARALNRRGPAATATISRAWKRLADARLITRGRIGRKARITALREDRSGRAYTAPAGATDDPYFPLPVAYWLENWYVTLSLAAKAMLLIALSLSDGFVLPFEKVAKWYGISADTAEKGLSELREAGLLTYMQSYRPAPLVGVGFVPVRRYYLKAAFRRAKKAAAASA